MKPFESTLGASEMERLRAFTQGILDALVPSVGECASVQGELIRAFENLSFEFYRNGMSNYYDEDDGSPATNHYGKLLLFVLDTLAENRNGALTAADVGFFVEARRRIEPDWVRCLRIRDLEQKEEELTEEEEREFDALDAQAADALPWDELFERGEWCIANWCVANPELIDRRGRPVEEGGVRDLRHVFNPPPPPPPPPCPLCNGRGFIAQKRENQFPELCSCKRA